MLLTESKKREDTLTTSEGLILNFYLVDVCETIVGLMLESQEGLLSRDKDSFETNQPPVGFLHRDFGVLYVTLVSFFSPSPKKDT